MLGRYFMLCAPWLLTLIYDGECKEETIIFLIWFIETVSKVLNVAASSAHEENLESDKVGIASAAQEISDTDSKSQDNDAEELWQTSEGAKVQPGLKCLCQWNAGGCVHWTSCKNMQNSSDALWLPMMAVFGISLLAEKSNFEIMCGAVEVVNLIVAVWWAQCPAQ